MPDLFAVHMGTGAQQGDTGHLSPDQLHGSFLGDVVPQGPRGAKFQGQEPTTSTTTGD